MRCMNCNMVMAANDSHCLSCGMKLTLPERGSVRGYTYGAAPVVPPPGMTAYGPAVAGGGGSRAGRIVKRLVGVAALALGSLLLLAAVAHGLDSKPKEAPPAPRTVTAAELAQVKDPAKLADAWVVYEAPKVLDTQVELVSGRFTKKTKVRFALVQVQDRWLLAEVPPNFAGTRLEGRLTKWNTPFYDNVVSKARTGFPNECRRLLPVQLDCEFDRATDGQRNDRTFTIGVGVVGFFILLLGLKFVTVRSPRLA